MEISFFAKRLALRYRKADTTVAKAFVVLKKQIFFFYYLTIT